MSDATPKEAKKPVGPSIFSLLKPYKLSVGFLIGLALLANGLTLALPKIIAKAIDAYIGGVGDTHQAVVVFLAVVVGIFIFTLLQGIVQAYSSERVAMDLRNSLADNISRQSLATIQTATSAKLLTNLTSDIDAIKFFVSQAIVSLVSSAVLIIGASILLFSINWKLALAVLSALPLIALLFFVVFAKVQVLFIKAQETIDRLNRVINESIIGAALIRVLHLQKNEGEKFSEVNSAATAIGMKILGMFAALIPLITFIANMAALVIVLLGGRFVINGSMSLGDFAAFTSYLATLIFPVLIIGFMSSVMARASASYARIAELLATQPQEASGTITATLRGDVEVKNVTMVFGDTTALDHVSFFAKAGTRTAIIGPTAAGKSTLLSVLGGLVDAQSGTVNYDGVPMSEYNKASLHKQVGLVFQDSVMFNLTLRENIAFSDEVTEADVEKAVATAELKDLIEALPEKLETMISERGTSLSGGQKQRIMLARALARNPKVLLLDDFTARVDSVAERNIIENVQKNYPGITLISVTQKISSVEEYDQIIVLMEGEVLASGTHQHLLATSPEYVQIYQSQRSISHYELPPTE